MSSPMNNLHSTPIHNVYAFLQAREPANVLLIRKGGRPSGEASVVLTHCKRLRISTGFANPAATLAGTGGHALRRPGCVAP